MIPTGTAMGSTKERILLAAKDRFLRDGFAGASVDDLVEELSISKKTFYKCFESKDDLLAEIVELIIRELDLGFQAILSSDESFVEKLDALMMFVGRQIGRIVRPFMFDLQRHAPHLWRRVLEFRRSRMAVNIQSLFQEGIRGGYIRQEINTRILLLAFVGTVESIMIPSLLANESFSADEAMRSILRIYFHGILTDDAGKQLRTVQNNPSRSLPYGAP